MQELGGANGHLHHVILAIGKESHAKHSVFTSERVAQMAANDWMEEKISLHDPSGQVLRPVKNAPEPTHEELRSYPGCVEAHLGLSKLNFQACALVGNKIKIRTDKLHPFTHCSPETTSKVAQLQEKHGQQFESALVSMAAPEAMADPAPPRDNRADEDPEPAEDAEELLTFESIDALKAKAKITVECKCSVKG
jgi:hypothetical protein